MSSPNFCNFNFLTNKSYCVFCLKGLPPIKKDTYYSSKNKKWYRQYHKGSCADSRDYMMEYDTERYYQRIKENKELITRAINNNKTPQQQKRLDDKKSKTK